MEQRFLTFDELEDGLNSSFTDGSFKVNATHLLSALHDWPTLNLNQPSALVHELKSFVHDGLTFQNLMKYSRQLSVSNDAWQIEAIESLLNMFGNESGNQEDNAPDLEMLIDRLTIHYRQVKNRM